MNIPTRGQVYEVVRDWPRNTQSNQRRNRNWVVGDRFVVDVVGPRYQTKYKDPEKAPWAVEVLLWGQRYWVNSHFLEHYCVRID
jgi:hypothetical protein